MTVYRRLGGESGVLAYRIAATAISVKFVDGKIYTYTYASAGRAKVEQMKLLARAGQGLSTYINKYVRDDYATVE
ncbi:MAG: hypothetical protein V4631_20790 [Pseudomonadota bacterium]